MLDKGKEGSNWSFASPNVNREREINYGPGVLDLLWTRIAYIFFEFTHFEHKISL